MYLSREAMTAKFDTHREDGRHIKTRFETRFAVGSYLAYQGDRFGDRFDANSYITLSMAMDLFDLGGTLDELIMVFGQSTCRWLLISFSTDWLFLPFQSQEIVNALVATNKPVSYCNIQSNCGHDAFLLPDDWDRYGEMTRAFLDNLEGSAEPTGDPTATGIPAAPTSIYQFCLEYELILDLIPQGASVLDLGCGAGGLLSRLSERGHQQLVGVELDEHAIIGCIRRGIDVLQLDLNEGLASFSDQQFDVVVLSQTLQAMKNVELLISEMLRVGRRCIVSFPNVAYEPLRRRLVELGHAPHSDTIHGYHWYDTPSVRYFSILDFEDFCRDKSIRIDQLIALNTAAGERVLENANAHADIAIMVLSR